MSKLLASGIAVTAVHNHLLRAQPATFYMHVEGHGDAAGMAANLHDALGGQPYAACRTGDGRGGAKPDIDVEQVEQVLGRKGNGQVACCSSAFRAATRSSMRDASAAGHGDRNGR